MRMDGGKVFFFYLQGGGWIHTLNVGICCGSLGILQLLELTKVEDPLGG